MSKPVQIRIEEDRKERWKNEAERLPHYRSLTDLIVTSVEAELLDDPPGSSDEIDASGIHDRFDSLIEKIEEMDETIDDTYMMVSRTEMSDYSDLKGRIQDMIPTGDREEILGRKPDTSPRETDVDELEDVIGRTGSTSHMIRLFQRDGYSPIEIQGAVEQLTEVRGIEATYAQPQQESDKRVYRVDE